MCLIVSGYTEVFSFIFSLLFFHLWEYSSVLRFEGFLTISFSCVSSHNSDTVFQNMLFLDKMLRHLHAISSSWDSFRQSDTFLQKMHQKIRSRSLPAYLALAACLTTLASLLFLSLGRIRHHWDGRIWDVDPTWPHGIVVQSSPRDMAANNTLGVSPTIQHSLHYHDDLITCFDSFRSYSRWRRVPAGAHEDSKRRRRAQISRLRFPFNHPSRTNSSAHSWTLAPKQASTPTGAPPWHG